MERAARGSTECKQLSYQKNCLVPGTEERIREKGHYLYAIHKACHAYVGRDRRMGRETGRALLKL